MQIGGAVSPFSRDESGRELFTHAVEPIYPHLVSGEPKTEEASARMSMLQARQNSHRQLLTRRQHAQGDATSE
eukprot:5510772-Pyramimonas_sp.AAC.1